MLLGNVSGHRNERTPSMNLSSFRRGPRLYGVIAALIAGFVLATTFFVPAPARQAEQAGGRVVFSAERGALLVSGSCVAVRWQAEGIRRLYLNGAGVVGEGEATVCPSTYRPPTLTIDWADDTRATLELPVRIVAEDPLAILALWGMGACLLMAWLTSGGWAWLASPQAGLVARALLIALVVVAVGWALLDLGLRWAFGAFGTREQRIMYLYSLDEVRALQSTLIHVPYVSYVPDPAFPGHNRLGYRGAEVAIPKPAGVFRIVALGGSTTYSTGTSAEESYPALLQEALRAEYGYEQIEVVNGGFIGYTSWELLASFAFRVLELDPDMILVYAAVNDLVVREQSQADCYAGLNPLRGLNPHRGLFVERNAPYPASTLVRVLSISLGWMPNPLYLDAAFEPARVICEADTAETTLEQRLASNPPTYFARNLRNLAALAQANGVQPVFSTWVYHTEAGRPELWRAGIAEHNEVIRDLARVNDIPLIDLAQDWPVNAAYWEADGIHMVAAGTREQARRYAIFLHEQGLLPAED